MWIFILLIIGAFFLFFFAIRADNKRKEGVHRKKYNNPNNPQLLSNQINERLGINTGCKPNEKFSKPNGNKEKRLRKQNKRLKPCGTRSAVDPIGRNGSNTYTSPSEMDSGSVDDLVAQWRKETAELQAESKVWEKEFSSLMGERAKASKFEKEGQLFEAISEYEQCVEEGISSPRFRIYNYAHDIDRLAILYRKTKQINKEVTFLERMIALHPEYTDRHKWKDRLTKAKNLLNK